ncbi:ATP-binding protein [Pectinatus brassicae]|uniref:NAD-dependent dihydropyrimidine dehydrogenase PreA subunit n=1 Tax=Pectinatus brassicae TaxID=862415 RepID=A0A840UUV7_9FIRM|nr:4Fe-4S binding protein [Pectinatus brassicae]MBB5336594.1 NAD-dependent dihydropyrimidine dehydrogenase PreA subunit [Pectinatus brassicae]
MLRKIIKIDKEKCNGCGICVDACHEGAIALINNKAELIHEHYCDGLGDCLPACPQNAISFEEREAPAYDEAAVKKAQAHKKTAFTCPGSAVKTFTPRANTPQNTMSSISQLQQWPVQIKLVPVSAPYFDNANLLIAADCTAFSYAAFHDEFIKNHITLIGCPKLDEGDYTEKLTAILKSNNIKSLSIVRMEVPCCGGLENAAKNALQQSGKFIPWQITVISTDGKIISD